LGAVVHVDWLSECFLGLVSSFHEVREGLYRGGHPDRCALEYLKDLGVTTILSLQKPQGSLVEGDTAAQTERERRDAAELGLAYVSAPMTSWASKTTYDALWNEVAPWLEHASGRRGLFVHCLHGRDRTGLVMGLERVLMEGWTPHRAYQEMVALGHSRLLVKLDCFFRFKTRSARLSGLRFSRVFPSP
jgi:protein tyrosine/serine phosphatase